MIADENGSKHVGAVERALSVLNAFLDAPNGMTLGEISEKTGLYKSTALRLLQTLTAHNFVARSEAGVYRLGSAPLRLSAHYQESTLPADIILPILRKLVLETGESASFNIAQDGVRICVYRVDSPQRVRDHIRPGDVLPLGKGAAGRVLHRFAQEGYQAVLSHPILLEQTVGDIDAHTAGVAVPVFGYGQIIVGALAVSGPAVRFDYKSMQKFGAALLKQGRDLTGQLSGNTQPYDAASS